MADTVNRLIVTKEDKKVRITAPYVDNHYDTTFASDAETLAGTEATKAVSPASLKSIVDVEGGLASTDYVDAGLALKANTTDVDDALALKADVTYAEYLMMEGDPA